MGKKASITQVSTGIIDPFLELLTTAEAAEILRVSRRTIEELGKAYDRGMTSFPPGEPPPSCPRFGLRRTRITPRKQYYHRLDLSEYLQNCRREAEGLGPIRLDPRVN